MKKKIFCRITSRINLKNIIVIMTILSIYSCSGTKPALKSLWYNRDLNFDINSSELQKSQFYLDGKSKILYNIFNDDKNIYLCAKTGENMVQMKILRAGFQITIDTTGKGKTKTEKLVSLTYPIPDEDEMGSFQPGMKSGVKSDKKARRSEFLLAHTDMKLSGFKSPTNDIVSLKNNFGINVNVDWDSINNMYYLVKIPFKTFYKESLLAKDSIKVFNVSFILNGLPKPDFSNRTEEGDNFSGGMGGGSRGGGMHGGGRGGSFGGGHGGGGHHQGGGGNEGSGDRGSLFETNKILVNVKLATGK
jgi:hypothetical protein